jgi:GNAT superfamily N-acetyltransferase
MLSITIQPAPPDAYAALARFHYRAGPPGLPVHTLTATDNLTRGVIGVLVVSMPALNGLWRPLAWPHLVPAGPRLLNKHVRTISRVVIDPRYRALGVARRLVRHYLDDPLTRYTEAVAAMGRCCPFFTRAGMSEVQLPPSRRDRALSRTLASLRLEPWELVELSRARSCLTASPTLRAAVAAWAADSRATRRHDPSDPDTLTQLCILSASSLTARPLAYVTPCHDRAA